VTLVRSALQKNLARNIAKMKSYVVISNNGTKRWWFKGLLHREDGPAIEWFDGGKDWYYLGIKHRENGPASECASGSKAWYIYGKRHRINGPAYESGNGNKFWFIEGHLHRLDGPAGEIVDGNKKEYYLWNINYSLEKYNQEISKYHAVKVDLLYVKGVEKFLHLCRKLEFVKNFYKAYPRRP
jgi:hypothetical protein